MSDLRILDETETNWLIEYPNGTIETVTKSAHNRLLYEYDLWGLLKNGSEIVQIEDDTDGTRVTITPNDDSTEFTLQVDDTEPLHIGEHHTADLVEALVDVYDRDEGVEPLVTLFHDIRENRVREEVMQAMGEMAPFEAAVTVQNDGWLIHGHLLLTWDQEFHHPNTTTRTVHGSAVSPGSSEPAYKMNFRSKSPNNRTITVDGAEYLLTDKEMEFLARALWAITEAPTPNGVADISRGVV